MMGEKPPKFIKKEDLLYEAQTALSIYEYLTDNMDHMNGRFLGKDYATLQIFFEIFNVDDLKEEILGLIKIIDYRVIKFYSDKLAQQAQVTANGKGRSKEGSTRGTR